MPLSVKPATHDKQNPDGNDKESILTEEDVRYVDGEPTEEPGRRDQVDEPSVKW